MKVKLIQVLIANLMCEAHNLVAQKTIYLTNNYNYLGGSMREGDEIIISSSKVIKTRLDGTVSEYTISGHDPYTGETVLNFHGFTVLMRDNPAQKRIFWKWSTTDFGWFNYETKKEKDAREIKERLKSEKLEIQKRKEWEAYRKKQQIRAIYIEHEIDSLLKAEKLNEASYLFLKYSGNSESNLNKYGSDILNKLTKFYSTDTAMLSVLESEKFIFENQKTINAKNPGLYTIKFNQEGKCYDTSFVVAEIRDLTQITVPSKRIGAELPNSLKIGDKFLDGVVIDIKDDKITIVSTGLICSDCNYHQAIEDCIKKSTKNIFWRLPKYDEIKKILYSENPNCNLLFWCNELSAVNKEAERLQNEMIEMLAEIKQAKEDYDASIADNSMNRVRKELQAKHYFRLMEEFEIFKQESEKNMLILEEEGKPADMTAIAINNPTNRCYNTEERIDMNQTVYYGPRSILRLNALAVSEINCFQVPLNSKFELQIDDVKEDTISKVYFSSGREGRCPNGAYGCKRPIYADGKGGFYYKTKKSLPECRYNSDLNMPPNTIRVEMEIERYKKANGQYVYREKYNTSKDYSILKKD